MNQTFLTKQKALSLLMLFVATFFVTISSSAFNNNDHEGCTDACAPNYDADATEDDGSCETYDTTCDPCVTVWSAQSCGCVDYSIIAHAGNNYETCSGTFALNGNAPFYGTGTWSGPGTFADANDPNTTVTLSTTTNGNYTFTWAVDDGCGSTASDNVTVTYNDELAIATGGEYDVICGLTTNLNAVKPIYCSGTWILPEGVTSPNPGFPSTTVTAAAAGTYTFIWNVECDGCSNNDEVVITFSSGCNDASACNYDATALCDDGSCIYPTTCDTDPCTNGGTYAWDATTCSCELETATVSGCTDAIALNYNAAANCNEGCEYDNSVPGCTDPCAANYNAAADTDDGSCDPYNTTCNDDCTAGDLSEWDSASCGCVVTTATVSGCTDATATNYDAAANCNEGCVYANSGCTDPCASNYDATADSDDGSCDPYNTTCNDDCTAGDLSEWDSASCGCVVTTATVSGCTDATATNYDAAANCNEGCVYANPGCTDACAPNYDATADSDDGSCEAYNMVCNDNCAEGNLSEWDANMCSCVVTSVTINGCTDATAINYNADANCDSGCEYASAGCTDPCAPNYDATAGMNDGSCEDYSTTCNTDCTMGDLTAWDSNTCGCVVYSVTVYGCTNPAATNYDSGANCNNGTCEFSNCIVGCSDPAACNYNEAACLENADIYCVYETACNSDCAMGDITAWNSATCQCEFVSGPTPGCSDPAACNYNADACTGFNAQYCIYETACNNDCTLGDLTAWNADICGCQVVGASYIGCTDPSANNYNANANCGDNNVYCTYGCVAGCSDPNACSYNPNACPEDDDIYCLMESNSNCNTDCSLGYVAAWNPDICNCQVQYYTVVGCTDPAANNYNPEANCGSSTDYCAYGCVAGCGDPSACNYVPNACTENDDTECISQANNPCNTDCTLGYVAAWNPEICNCQVQYYSVVGCTDPDANNYNPEANCGGADYCSYGATMGCTDPCANNFDPNAEEDNGSCNEYSTECNSDCINGDITEWDAASCGCVVISTTVYGCTDSAAINYDLNATCDNGTCILLTSGCTDPCASNYDADADLDDGTCEAYDTTCNTDCTAGDLEDWDADVCGCVTTVVTVLGCTDATANNYDAAANCNDGCEYDKIGCTDPCAPNYDADADLDDGTCEAYDTTCNTDCTAGDLEDWDADVCGCVTTVVTVLGCTDATANNYDAAANCNDGCEYDKIGCTDPCAPNYDADADLDDGTCEAYDTTCNTDCTAGDLEDWDADVCGCVTTVVTVLGCTDATANNYDAAANCNDGCEYDKIGCTDPCAPNYDADADLDDGTCEAYDTTCNTDCTAGDLEDWDADVCGCVTTVVTVLGCTDATANNYDAAANCNDGCTYDEIGCTDPCAPNYDADADLDDGTCEVYDTTCNSDCTKGNVEQWNADVCGCVIAFTTITGCTDKEACNFDPDATCNDGCDYSCFCEIEASAQVVCSPQGDYYQLILIFSGSSNGSYLVTDNNTDESIIVTEPFYQTVAFEVAGNEGFSYTVSLTADVNCNKTVSQSVIDCTTTAVELIDFNGYSSESGNHLNWVTATEMNADMYIVEKSLNGTDFEEIGKVKAQGNSSVSNSYNFLDVNANERVSYYRLTEMNQTGEKTKASNVVTISRTRNNIDIISISPIPANDYINVAFDAESSSNYQVDLFDITGKLVRSTQGEMEVGQNNINIDLTELPTGSYFLTIFDGEEKQVVRILKD